MYSPSDGAFHFQVGVALLSNVILQNDLFARRVKNGDRCIKIRSVSSRLQLQSIMLPRYPLKNVDTYLLPGASILPPMEQGHFDQVGFVATCRLARLNSTNNRFR